jgi:hypothetical protein
VKIMARVFITGSSDWTFTALAGKLKKPLPTGSLFGVKF